MRVRTSLAVVCLLSAQLLPPQLAAQDSAASTACTYDACALRIRGSEVLAGIEARKVASFGFLAGPTLGPWIEVSDSATYHVRTVRRDYGPGSVLQFGGALLTYAGLLLSSVAEGGEQEWVGLGMMALGMPALLVGNRRVRRARVAMQDAIWWYNAGLGPAGSNRDRSLPYSVPEAGLQHRGRAGLVLGSLVGVGVGLAVSTRNSRIGVAQGLTETLVLGVAGGWLGWRIGLGVDR